MGRVDRFQSSCCWIQEPRNQKINPPVTKRSPIAIPKPENANLNENSIEAAAWRSLWAGWTEFKVRAAGVLCLQGPRIQKSTHPLQNAVHSRSRSLKTQTRMKLASRLQPGEAFWSGGRFQSSCCWSLCAYNCLEPPNLPTRVKTHSNVDPEA